MDNSDRQQESTGTGISLYLSKLRPCFVKIYKEKVPLHGIGDEGQSFIHTSICELVAVGADDSVIHEYFKIQPDYDYDKVQKQLNKIRSKGYKPYTCKKLQSKCPTILKGMCNGCIRLSDEKLRENIRKNAGKKSKDGDSKEPSFKDILLEYVESIELFHNEQKEPYARVPIDAEHYAILQTKSKDFKRWLSNKCYKDTGKAASASSIADVLNTIEGRAVFEGKMHNLHVRACRYEGYIWYDIGNNEAVKIGNGKCEIVKKEVPILFKWHSHMQAHENVVLEGDPKKLLEFVNIKDEDDQILFIVIVVSYLIPDIPRLLLAFHGHTGAAKSTAMRFVRRLVDPSITELLPMKKDPNELVQQLSHHYLTPYDNVSSISLEQSDILCKAITGDGNTKRALYTDEDDIIFAYLRAIMINGINIVATQPDLMNRGAFIGIAEIPEELRKEDKVINAEFNDAKPEILGGIFQTLAKAMEIYPTITLDRKPRMADFCRWGCAIAEALGYGKDKFLNAYYKNMDMQNEEALDSSLMGNSIRQFMSDKPEWQGQPSDFYNELIKIVQATSPGIMKDKYFPRAPNALSRHIERLTTNLKKVGIIFEKHSDGDQRWIILKNEKFMNKASPEPVQQTDRRKVIDNEELAVQYIKSLIQCEFNDKAKPTYGTEEQINIFKTINQRVNIGPKDPHMFERCYEKAWSMILNPNGTVPQEPKAPETPSTGKIDIPKFTKFIPFEA